MGVLSGYKVVEFAGIGPAPMCAMLLSDMGAEVLRIDRAEDANLGISTDAKFNVLGRGRRSVAIDLKRKEGTEVALKLIAKADATYRRFSPWRDGAFRTGPELHGTQSKARVWPHDRLGPGRTNGTRRWTRH